MLLRRFARAAFAAAFALAATIAAAGAGTGLRELRESSSALASAKPTLTPGPGEPKKGPPATPPPSMDPKGPSPPAPSAPPAPGCVAWIPPDTPQPPPPELEQVGRKFSVDGNVTAKGAPLPNAHLAVYQGGYPSTASIYPQIAETRTDVSGRFALSLVSGTYRIVVTPPSTLIDHFGVWYGGGRGFGTATDVIVARGDVHLGSIALPKVTTLSGRVTGMDGKSVAGAGVRVSRATLSRAEVSDAAFALTAADGTYRALVLPGTYRIAVEPPEGSGYRGAWYGGAADWCTSPNVAVGASGTSGVDVVVPRGLIISGTVRGAGGVALQGISLQFYRVEPPANPGEWGGMSASTDRLGHYAAIALDGRYRLEVQDPSAYGYEGGIDAALADIRLSGTDRVLDLTLRPASTHVKISRDSILAAVRATLPNVARLERIEARLQELGSFQRVGHVTWPGAGEHQRAWAVAISGDFTAALPAGTHWILLLYDPNTGAKLPWELRGTEMWPSWFSPRTGDWYAESPGPFVPVPILVTGIIGEYNPAPPVAFTESERGVIAVSGHRYYIANGISPSVTSSAALVVGTSVTLRGYADELGVLVDYAVSPLGATP